MTTTPTLSPTDLYAIDTLLNPEQVEIRDTVRRFADEHLRPHLAGWFEAGELPVRELARELGSLGVLGMHLEGYGCAGTDATSYGLACLELEAADSGIRSLVSVQGSLAMFAIHEYGSEEQRQQWLPGMAAGELIGCFGLTEPDAGSDPGSMRTTAVRDGDDWVPQRHEDVDHQRLGRRRGRRVGARRGDDPRVRRPDRLPRIHRPLDPAQAQPARVSHLASWSSRACACPPTRCSPALAGCPAHSGAWPRPGTASCSARSAPPATASRPPWRIPARASSSAGRSPGSS